MNEDLQQLRLLAIFHTICAILGALISCVFITHIAIGLAVVNGRTPFGMPGPPTPSDPFGWILVGIGALFVLIGWTCSFLTWLSGRCLRGHRRRLFSFVIAALLCASFPFGTVLGVFTIIVLSRESVRRLYEQETAVRFSDGAPPVSS